MNKSEFQQLCSLYETRLLLLKNPVCVRCDAKIRNPLAVWHIGSEFRASKIRLLFVGKPHRGKPGIIRPSGLIDPRERVKELRHMSWPYWNYTVEISKLLFGTSEKGWERIAFTNLVKCTNVGNDETSADQTTELMVRSCVLDLGVISAEIELLQPTHVVFYTGKLFPNILEVLPIEGKRTWRDIEKSSVKCGQKKLSWWEREITTSWGNMRVLITGHPERMEKVSYTQLIAGWAHQSG